MEIRQASLADLDALLEVEAKAFGEVEGPIVSGLVSDLLNDASASPHLSLVAISGSRLVGHILFTKASLDSIEGKYAMAILAPLAVLPEFQNKGVGKLLVKEGLKRLAKLDTALVFVLGHPQYYPEFGFEPAGAVGLEAPYPILEKNAGAWMVLALGDDLLNGIKGKVRCAVTMDRPEYWQE